MKKIEENYELKCKTISDINEHLPILKKYAEECDVVIEMGVRNVVSTWALLLAKPKKLIIILKNKIQKSVKFKITINSKE